MALSALAIIGVAGGIGYISYKFITWMNGKPTSRNRNRNQPSTKKDDLIVLGWPVNPELRDKLKPHLIEPSKLIRGVPIGEGNFGEVFLGELRINPSKTVAIKTLKGPFESISPIEQFLDEAVILKGLKHANVLSTLAVCISNGEPQVVLPYMAKGDLKQLLQGDNTIPFLVLMDFGKQVSCGMEFLAKRKIVHRDLAARNCLVDDNDVVKVADFGLAREVYGDNYYRRSPDSQTALPLKWLAVESLRNGLFTSESDVWSFGVLMWEICTRGAEPYSNVTFREIKQYVISGGRPDEPGDCSPIVWELMQRCWSMNPESRPTFSNIYEALTNPLAGYDWDNALTYR